VYLRRKFGRQIFSQVHSAPHMFSKDFPNRFMFANIRVRGSTISQGITLTDILITDFSETDENWDPSTLEQLSSIRVVFTQVQMRKSKPSRITYFKGALPAEKPLDEKSKKAGTHGAW
jgi:hypothetical protein